MINDIINAYSKWGENYVGNDSPTINDKLTFRETLEELLVKEGRCNEGDLELLCIEWLWTFGVTKLRKSKRLKHWTAK